MGGPVSVAAVADTFVRGGSYASSNYGGDTRIRVKGSNNSTYNRESLVRFNLSQFNPASGAPVYLILKLADYSGNGAGSGRIDVRECTSDSWAESAVNWNTRPVAGTSINFANLSASDVGTEIAFDVTSYVNAQKSADGVASFILNQPLSNDVLFGFLSREGGAAPKLVSTTGN